MKWYPIVSWFPPIDFKEFYICIVSIYAHKN